MPSLLLTLAALVCSGPAIHAADELSAELSVDTLGLANIAARFQHWDVIAVPDRDEAEWWAGAPSLARDDEGNFWMAARMRSPDRPLGKRGYEIRIFRSADGVHFDHVHSLKREDVPLPGFERPSLRRDPRTGKFKLYACGRLNGPWSIFKFDDVDRPDQFVASTAKGVIEPAAEEEQDPGTIVGTYTRPAPVPTGYKDAVINHLEGRWHCFTIGVTRSTERTYHFTSEDGESWQPVGPLSQSVMDLAGWHDWAVRPASILPLGFGYLYVYEGSDTRWNDPVYNIATGLGFTFDLTHVIDLTPDRPLLQSTTPGRLKAWRYSEWMWVDDQIWVYAENERPNGSHEIRRFVLDRQ
ncbi:MAG: hypothetical protein KDA63_01370 [Planctomycetales bacterium]|nr:hypothetical protein [Planctomycetales bacterium]